MPEEGVRAFWERTLASLREVPLDASLEPVEEFDVFTMEGRVKTRKIYRAVVTSFEGCRIRAWYVTPAAQPPPNGWPAIMTIPGYNGTLPPPFHLVQYGYATLTLYPRGQGESAKEWKVDRDARATYRIDDRDRYYYRGAFMDCVRGVDFLCARPEVDPHRVGVWGSSQGGGLGLATAALDQRISAVVAGTPWPGNFPIAVDVMTTPYSELRDHLLAHPEHRDAVLRTLAYFDPLNLVDSIRCPTLVAGVVKDDVHPIATVMPVFERIQAIKSIVVYPDPDHEYRTDFAYLGKIWMDRYLR